MAPRILAYWLSKDPFVVRYVTPPSDDATAFPDTRIYRLPFHHWHATADQVEQQYCVQRANRPRHVVNYLLNEQDVYDEVVKRGIPATFFNQNATVDERIFSIRPNAVKEFDAVYNARMSPFKRHWLAGRIPRLLSIAGIFARSDDEEYFEQVRAEMPHAEYIEARPGSFLQPTQIVHQISRARVGLCLSACEGAMYAAVEYLLCGIPVVSTESVGGRSEWFDPDYVRVVSDAPEAVQQAVQELARLKISPHLIRERTLIRVQQHRQRFIGLVQSIYDREGLNRRFSQQWNSQFFNKFGHWRTLDEIMDAVEVDCP